MGTRHLTIVVANDEYKIAQYGQWDGYPSGQGKTVVQFLNKLNRLDRKEGENLEVFKQKVLACSELSNEDLQAKWVECGADPKDQFVTMDVSDAFGQKYPYLSRNCGAEILQHVLDSENGLELSNALTFASDSLFCEWAWLVDLDNNVLEVYRGFNKEPLPDDARFKYLEETEEFKAELERREERGSVYYPIALYATFSFEELPQTEEEFAAWYDDLNPYEDEDEEA